MAGVSNVSGTANPYESSVYTPQSNEKNTLTIDSYIQLLATQLRNQDVSNPMDSSEMMNQLSQMAMVQALSTLTTTMEDNDKMNTTTYVSSMIGKGVTVAVTEKNSFGSQTVTGSKYGVVKTVNLSGSEEPTFRLEGDDTDYPASSLMGIGDITGEGNTSTGVESGETLNGNGASAASAAKAASYVSKPPTEGDVSPFGEIVSAEERTRAAENAQRLAEEQLKARFMNQSLFPDGTEDEEDEDEEIGVEDLI